MAFSAKITSEEEGITTMLSSFFRFKPTQMETPIDSKLLERMRSSIIVLSADDLRTVLREYLGQPGQQNAQKKSDYDELIGTAEACKILGVCAKTMDRYRRLRLFDYTMRGPHKVLYKRGDIEAFREQCIARSREYHKQHKSH